MKYNSVMKYNSSTTATQYHNMYLHRQPPEYNKLYLHDVGETVKAYYYIFSISLYSRWCVSSSALQGSVSYLSQTI